MSTFFKNHKLGFASALVLTASLAFCFVVVNHTSDGNESAGNTDVSENMVEEAMPFATGDEVVTEKQISIEGSVPYTSEEREVITTSMEEADKLAQAGDYEAAIQEIDQTRESYPEAKELLEKREEYSKLHAEQMKTNTLERCEKLASEGDYLTAINMLTSCMETYGEDNMSSEKLENYKELYKQNVIQESSRYVDEGEDYISAIHLIQSFQKELGDDPELKTILLEYETTYVSNVLSETESLLTNADFDGAEQKIKSAQQEIPGNSKLDEALKRVQSSRPQSLMAVCPPYNSVNCIFNSGTDTINMGGRTYINSIFIGENLYDDSRLDYNLEGKYSSITFEVGHVDGTGLRSREMQVLYNEQFVRTIDLSGTGLPKSIKLDVTDVDQLTLIIPTGLAIFGERACYGMANAYAYPVTSSLGENL